MRLNYLLIVLAFAPLTAHAEDVPLACEAPTQYEGNTPILAGTAITYNVYSAASGQPKKLVTPTPIAACSSLRTNVAPGNWCWEATAIIAGIESAHSAEFCKVILAPPPPPPPPPPKPKPPTNLRAIP